MVSAVLFNHRLHLLPRISIANQRRLNLHDLLLLSVRFRLTLDLPLRPSLAYNSINALHSSRSPHHQHQHQQKTPSTMATKSDNLTETVKEEIDKGEEKKKKKKELTLPPPPEKPEPGDCCGSGCVRCVWDVYYEELDEYDKLCTSISGETKPS